MLTGKVLLLGGAAAAVLLFAATSKASARTLPPPGDNPNPGPGPEPPPPPSSLQGKSADELAELAAADVRSFGWYSGHGIVRAFQAQYNKETGAHASVDDKWGPDTYNMARVCVADPSTLPAPYFGAGTVMNGNVVVTDPAVSDNAKLNGLSPNGKLPNIQIHIAKL